MVYFADKYVQRNLKYKKGHVTKYPSCETDLNHMRTRLWSKLMAWRPRSDTAVKGIVIYLRSISDSFLIFSFLPITLDGIYKPISWYYRSVYYGCHSSEWRREFQTRPYIRMCSVPSNMYSSCPASMSSHFLLFMC